MEEHKKRYSASTIIITVLATIIIIILAFLLYYYSVKIVSLANAGLSLVTKNVTIPLEKPIVPTNVITFASPDILPALQENGECFTSSVAAPYRKDAWRCMVLNSIYDPCFETKEKGLVYCQTNPLLSDFVLIKITKALPQVSIPENTQDNWAWFLTLEDGTYCSPFTGTRPFFGKDKVAYYGCNSDNKDQQIVLLGDLARGNVWTANEAILIKSGGVPPGSWVINSSRQVNIKTIWQ